MNETFGTCILDHPVMVPGATKEIAAGHPAPRLPLAEDDGVEGTPIASLNRHHPAAALRQVIGDDPCLERLLAKLAAKRSSLDKGVLAIQDETAVGDAGLAMKRSMQFADDVVSVEFKCPATDGRRHDLRVRTRLAHRESGPHRLFECCDLPLALGDFLIELSNPRFALALLLGRQDRPIALPHSGEDRSQAIVIALRDRIEFVIVAASTIDRHAEKGLAHDTDDVLEFLLANASRSEALTELFPASSNGPAVRKLVATMLSRVGSGRTSPAICSRTK